MKSVVRPNPKMRFDTLCGGVCSRPGGRGSSVCVCVAELKLQQAQRRVQTNAVGAWLRPCGLQTEQKWKLKREKLKKKQGKQGNANRKLPQNDLTGHARKACAERKGKGREGKGERDRERVRVEVSEGSARQCRIKKSFSITRSAAVLPTHTHTLTHSERNRGERVGRVGREGERAVNCLQFACNEKHLKPQNQRKAKQTTNCQLQVPPQPKVAPNLRLAVCIDLPQTETEREREREGKRLGNERERDLFVCE